MKWGILGRIPISCKKGILSFHGKTWVCGAWAATGTSHRLVSWCISTFQRLPTLLLRIPGWQPQWFFLNSLVSGNPFLSFHMPHFLLSKAPVYLFWIPQSSVGLKNLTVRPWETKPLFLTEQSRSRHMKEHRKSQVTQYIIESMGVVTKSLDGLLLRYSA